jgi:antitoxin component of MazEF toxin-antitoxin module
MKLGAAVARKVTKIGGSLGLIIPHDFAEAMGVTSGSEVRLVLVGSKLTVAPLERTRRAPRRRA